MDDTKQSRVLLAIVIIAIVALGGGVMWYATRDVADAPSAGPTNIDPRTNDTRMPSGESENIIVYLPRPNERIGSPIVIEGQARVFENVVSYRLLDTRGGVIAEGFTSATPNDIGQFGPFRAELTYSAPADGQGTLEIFWYSARDGMPTDVVSIPVIYTKTPEFIKG